MKMRIFKSKAATFVQLLYGIIAIEAMAVNFYYKNDKNIIIGGNRIGIVYSSR